MINMNYENLRPDQRIFLELLDVISKNASDMINLKDYEIMSITDTFYAEVTNRLFQRFNYTNEQRIKTLENHIKTVNSLLSMMRLEKNVD
jgi:Mg2+ and Co2+ transporter CorA